MDIYQVPLRLKQNKPELTFIQKLRKAVFAEKMTGTTGLLLFALLAVVIGLFMGATGIIGGAMVVLLIIAVPIVRSMVAYPKAGVIALMTMAYFIMLVIKFNIPFPLGTLMDALEVLLIFGFFVQQKRKRDYTIFKNSVSLVVAIWIGFNVLEVVNPVADSMMAWVYTVRTIAFVTLMYFVFLSSIDSVRFIRTIVVIWLGFSVIAALYGMKQEHSGYSQFEWISLAGDPQRAALLLIDGHWRKFSIFEGPVTFAYQMVMACLLSICLIWGTSKLWRRLVLVVLIVMCFLSMIYSGTRGAFALVPAGLILFCILNFNKNTFIFGTVFAGIFITLMFIPTTDQNLRRFQTAFKPSKDPSYLLRQANQQRIKPYIRSHPIGGGLGSVGVWGQKFSPNSMLAHFPPDSGYVRVAVETGWIGIILLCTLMFVILYTGIQNFFIIKNRELKTYSLAMTVMIFALEVGNYPQEALVQYPSNVYFYLMIAILVKCGQLDKKMQQEEKAKVLSPQVTPSKITLSNA
jgi:putative inorganic carbon (HCO3(-)) transporter